MGHGVVDAAVLGEDGLLFFQHENLLAEHAGAYRGPRERAGDDEADLAVRVCQGDGGRWSYFVQAEAAAGTRNTILYWERVGCRFMWSHD